MKFYSFSRSGFNLENFSKFVLDNFQIGFEYCIYLKFKCYKGGFIRCEDLVYVKVLGFNDPNSLLVVFNKLNNKIEEEDWLLDESISEDKDVVCIQYTTVTKDFNDLEFEKLADKDIPLLTYKDIFIYRNKLKKLFIKKLDLELKYFEDEGSTFNSNKKGNGLSIFDIWEEEEKEEEEEEEKNKK